MAFYLNLKKEEKEKLIKTWELLAKKFEKFGYKPTEATEEQIEYINSLARLLDRRDNCNATVSYSAESPWQTG
ncbi:hypothetical protein HYU22_02335 [Candidatus Woesearchaeota archaeon]|nr:hypothetical protein [Candidatus Woesearchaeota archaeon]